jgi:hypothetical protein
MDHREIRTFPEKPVANCGNRYPFTVAGAAIA